MLRDSKRCKPWGDRQREKTGHLHESANQKRGEGSWTICLYPHLWPMDSLRTGPTSPHGSHFHPLILSLLRKHTKINKQINHQRSPALLPQIASSTCLLAGKPPCELQLFGQKLWGLFCLSPSPAPSDKIMRCKALVCLTSWSLQQESWEAQGLGSEIN